MAKPNQLGVSGRTLIYPLVLAPTCPVTLMPERNPAADAAARTSSIPRDPALTPCISHWSARKGNPTRRTVNEPKVLSVPGPDRLQLASGSPPESSMTVTPTLPSPQPNPGNRIAETGAGQPSSSRYEGQACGTSISSSPRYDSCVDHSAHPHATATLRIAPRHRKTTSLSNRRFTLVFYDAASRSIAADRRRTRFQLRWRRVVRTAGRW